jgi:hypothetical protein
MTQGNNHKPLLTFEEWQDFHHELDLAVTTFMLETGKVPFRTTLMEFMEFSAKKCGYGLRHFTAVNKARKELE